MCIIVYFQRSRFCNILASRTWEAFLHTQFQPPLASSARKLYLLGAATKSTRSAGAPVARTQLMRGAYVADKVIRIAVEPIWPLGSYDKCTRKYATNLDTSLNKRRWEARVLANKSVSAHETGKSQAVRFNTICRLVLD